MSDDEKKCEAKDVVTIGPDLGGGIHPAVRHDANHQVSLGMLHVLKDGEPLRDDTLILQKNGEGSEYDVVAEVSAKGEVTESRGGPAMVATKAYRNGWENIFGKKQPVGEA